MTKPASQCELSVVIPVYNRRDITLAALARLRGQTRLPDRVIVVDGGSTDGTPERINEEFPEVTVLHCPGCFWGEAMARGIDYVLALNPGDDDTLVMLNDDTLAPPEFISVLERTSKREAAAVAPVFVDIDNPSHILEAGTYIDWQQYRFSKTTEKPEAGMLRDDVDVLPGRGTAIPIRVIRRVGNIDDSAFPHYIADYDFFCRMRKGGFRMGVTGDTWIGMNTRTTGISETQGARGVQTAAKLALSRRSRDNIVDHWRFIGRHAPRRANRLRAIMVLRRLLTVFPKSPGFRRRK